MKKKPSQKSLDKDLLESVKAGDLDRVKDSLIAGADIHAQENCVLRCAAGYGHPEVAKLLLDRGADIHDQDDKAFRWAAGSGHIETVRLLLDRVAGVHANNSYVLSTPISTVI